MNADESADKCSGGVQVPYTRIAPELLRRLAEEFVTRDGTDYGAAEQTLETKVADVMRQLARGDAAVVYDPDTETTNIVPSHALP